MEILISFNVRYLTWNIDNDSEFNKLHCVFMTLTLKGFFCLNTLLLHSMYKFLADDSTKIDPESPALSLFPLNLSGFRILTC